MITKANISDEYPEPFRKAVSHIRVKKDYDYSITELLKPLQEIYLIKNNDVEIDALKNTAALLGTAFHNYMEIQDLNDPNDWIIEQRNYVKVDDMVISGQFDLYNVSTKTLWDYKTASLYKVEKAIKSTDMRKGAREWVIQTNAYRYLSGLNIKQIKILAVIKDFSYSKRSVVNKPAVVIEIPLVKLDDIEKWLWKRVGAIKKVLNTGIYPECTYEDRWRGKRCENYCDVAGLCEQFNGLNKNGELL